MSFEIFTRLPIQLNNQYTQDMHPNTVVTIIQLSLRVADAFIVTQREV